MIREFTILAWRNIWRNKRRSYITMSSVAFAVLLACVMMSVQIGSLDHMVESMVKFYTGNIQVHHPDYWQEKTINHSMELPSAIFDSLDHLEGVKAVVPRVESFALAAYGTKTKGAMVLGVDVARESAIMNLEKKLIKGNYFRADEKSVLVAAGLADYLKIDVGDSLVLFGQGYHGVNAIGLYRVGGLMKFPNPEQNKQLICMPIRQAQWLYGLGNQYTSIAFLTDNAKAEKSLQKHLKSMAETTNWSVMNWKEILPELVQTVKLKYASSKIMIMVLYIVIGFGMFGTFLMMTAERYREFGILVSVGMHKAWLQATVFIEVLLMSLIGVATGIVMSLGIIGYFTANPPQMGRDVQAVADNYGVEAVIAFSMSPQLFFWQAWAIFIISFVLSFYPMLVIRRLMPVDAMRI